MNIIHSLETLGPAASEQVAERIIKDKIKKRLTESSPLKDQQVYIYCKQDIFIRDNEAVSFVSRNIFV